MTVMSQTELGISSTREERQMVLLEVFTSVDVSPFYNVKHEFK